MVKHITLLMLLFSSLSVASEPLSAADLRARMQGSEAEKKASSQRLKMMRDGKNQVGILNERNLFYELPNGKKVRAILLPNGKRSPAITEKGELVPACFTTRGTLVAGQYDVMSKSITCNIPAADIAYIDDDIYVKDNQSEVAGNTETSGKNEEVLSVNKYSNSNSTTKPTTPKEAKKQAQTKSKGSGAPAAAPVAPRPANFYMPSISQNAGAAAVAVVALNKEKPYGIQRGTWAEVRLTRSVSSSDSGSAEFYLQDSLEGTYQALPAGTVFFANKRINMSTRRMEAFVTLAKLPSGKEVKVSGWIYSLNQTAGLNGVLERDREGENQAAAGNAALASLGAAASTIGGAGSVAGTAVDSYTGDMVSNQRTYSTNAPTATIRVSPQRALIQITEPF